MRRRQWDAPGVVGAAGPVAGGPGSRISASADVHVKDPGIPRSTRSDSPTHALGQGTRAGMDFLRQREVIPAIEIV